MTNRHFCSTSTSNVIKKSGFINALLSFLSDVPFVVLCKHHPKNWRHTHQKICRQVSLTKSLFSNRKKKFELSSGAFLKKKFWSTLLRSLKWHKRCQEGEEEVGNADEEFLADLRFNYDIYFSTLQPKFRAIDALDESTPAQRTNGRGRPRSLPVNLSRQRYNRTLTCSCLFHACNLLWLNNLVTAS